MEYVRITFANAITDTLDNLVQIFIEDVVQIIVVLPKMLDNVFLKIN